MKWQWIHAKGPTVDRVAAAVFVVSRVGGGGQALAVGGHRTRVPGDGRGPDMDESDGLVFGTLWARPRRRHH